MEKNNYAEIGKIAMKTFLKNGYTEQGKTTCEEKSIEDALFHMFLAGFAEGGLYVINKAKRDNESHSRVD